MTLVYTNRNNCFQSKSVPCKNIKFGTTRFICRHHIHTKTRDIPSSNPTACLREMPVSVTKTCSQYRSLPSMPFVEFVNQCMDSHHKGKHFYFILRRRLDCHHGKKRQELTVWLLRQVNASLMTITRLLVMKSMRQFELCSVSFIVGCSLEKGAYYTDSEDHSIMIAVVSKQRLIRHQHNNRHSYVFLFTT